MIYEALKYLVDLGSANRKIDVAKVDDRRYILTGPNGHEWVDAPIPLITHGVRDIQSLVSALARWGTGGEQAVFVGPEFILGVLDHEKGVDTVTLKLQQSEAYQQLGRLERRQDQAEAINVLRRYYEDYLADDTLISRFRTLRWTSMDDATADIQPETKALSRAVSAKVTGSDQLPESFDMALPVYAGMVEHSIDVLVKVKLLVHPEDRQLEFKLEPDARVNAITTALNHLQYRINQALDDAGVDAPVLLGHL